MAKLLGSYAELEGGKVTWALRVLTGDEVFVFYNEPEDESWTRLDMPRPKVGRTPI